jgi:hypothetical protein
MFDLSQIDLDDFLIYLKGAVELPAHEKYLIIWYIAATSTTVSRMIQSTRSADLNFLDVMGDV